MKRARTEPDRHPFRPKDEVYQGRIPSRLENRERVIQDVLRSLEAAGCRPDPFFDRLCLDEMISNAILHGNRQDPDKAVTVRAFSSRDRWGFEVADEGPGFDWEKVLEGLKDPPERGRDSGRGLALVISSGAEVHFLEGGRRVVVMRRM